MGLGPLAFTPARNVVLGEGPSECVLLPTLLREAAKVPQLPFQVGPGAANVSNANFSDLQAEGGRVAFVLDGDAAGEKTKKELVEAGADPDQIRSYKDFFDSPIVFEDLIDPNVYVMAFNDELNRWQEPPKQLTAAELPKEGRASFVDRWCQEQGLDPVTKPTLCQRLAEMAAGGTKILAADKERKLTELYDWLLSKFEPKPKTK
jgi:predicted ATP-dependent endonuclease of OLD family